MHLNMTSTTLADLAHQSYSAMYYALKPVLKLEMG